MRRILIVLAVVFTLALTPWVLRAQDTQTCGGVEPPLRATISPSACVPARGTFTIRLQTMQPGLLVSVVLSGNSGLVSGADRAMRVGGGGELVFNTSDYFGTSLSGGSYRATIKDFTGRFAPARVDFIVAGAAPSPTSPLIPTAPQPAATRQPTTTAFPTPTAPGSPTSPVGSPTSPVGTTTSPAGTTTAPPVTSGNTAEVLAYLNQLSAINDNYGDALQSIGEQTDKYVTNPTLIRDATWLEATEVALVELDASGGALGSISPVPAPVQTLDRILKQIAAETGPFVDDYVAGIDEGDTARITSAIQRLGRITALFNESTREIQRITSTVQTPTASPTPRAGGTVTPTPVRP